MHVVRRKWFPLNSFLYLFQRLRCIILHVDDVSKGVYQVERRTVDVEKIKKGFFAIAFLKILYNLLLNEY